MRIGCPAAQGCATPSHSDTQRCSMEEAKDEAVAHLWPGKTTTVLLLLLLVNLNC